ncbi:hypothetical protein RND81_12G056500 [Saponaria officinalis]|uniref:DUF4371 domain-containing protein n=1 Tax=Saponaria officinalis TaxID=3572 RepID=A0AAW1H5M2_SAPOF
MSKNKKIDDFFKKRSQDEVNNSNPCVTSTDATETENPNIEESNDHESNLATENPNYEEPPLKVPRVKVSDQLYLEHDPGKRKPIWEYQTSTEQNEIRKNFLQKGPYTWHTAKYPSDQKEYSPTTNVAYCLPCFLYAKPSGRQRENAFTIEGFRSWNKHCAFWGHDESVGSLNRGYFLEFIQAIASFIKDVEKVVLENASGNASYTSHQIQQEILSIYSGRIQDFFSKLTFIVNIITSSVKRHDQLQAAHLAEIERLLELEDLETGKGKNQIGTIKRAGDTRWGSHFGSLNSLLNMYNASCSVLQTVIKEGKGAQRGEEDKAYDDMTSFEFVLVLHIMIQILGITNDLCQALQRKSQDILNAMHLVSNTKILIQKLRDDGWEILLQQVLLFCNNHDIEVPNMEDHYIYGRGRFRQPKDRVTNLHYFRYDVFIAAINSQLHELDFRFNDEMIEFISLSSSLDPKRKFQNFKTDDIYKLVSKFYPADFTEQEKLNLKSS